LSASLVWILTSLVIDFAPGKRQTPQQFAQIAAHVPGKLEKLSLKSPDGVKISAWYLPANVQPGQERWGVVLSHGGGDDKTYYLPLAEKLRDDGFDIILPDLRGAGESDPSPDGMTLGITEGQDVATAAAFLADRKNVSHIAAVGVSMGGVSVVMGASQEPRIGPLVVASSSYRAQRVFDLMLAQFKLPDGSFRAGLSRLLSSVGVWRMGADWEDARKGVLPTWSLAPKMAPRPVLFIYGDSDPLIHAEDIALFRKRFTGPTQVIEARGAGHGVYKYYPAAFSAAVTHFLEDWRAGRPFESGSSFMGNPEKKAD
jgi:pimeloyl-ACP methyl ester carboxylesterase